MCVCIDSIYFLTNSPIVLCLCLLRCHCSSNSFAIRVTFHIYKIFVTCCILSKSKQGRWGRCIRWFACLICRRLGDTEQWNNFAGGLIDCTSIEILGLSHEIFIFSRSRPQSLSISGVFERYIIVPRCGFSASIGGDVRKFTTGAGIFSKKLRTCTATTITRNWKNNLFKNSRYIIIWCSLLTSSSELWAIDLFRLSVVTQDVVDDDGDLNGSISSRLSDNSSTRLLMFDPLITSSSSSELFWSYIRQFDAVTTFKKERELDEQSVYDSRGFLSIELTELKNDKSCQSSV